MPSEVAHMRREHVKDGWWELPGAPIPESGREPKTSPILRTPGWNGVVRQPPERIQKAGVNVLSSPMLHANHQLVLDRAAALRLPTIYQWPELAEEGGFAAYGPCFDQIIRDLVARQLVQLFRGTKPVEQPTKFELVINLKTAKAMDVTVPEALLVRSDKVIE
jgi:ABC transporter substrate binding protein